MKKRNFLIIIAIVGILFINIIDANALQATPGGGSGGTASTTCTYVWEQNAFFGDQKDSQGLAIPVDTTFALQTETSSNKLTKIEVLGKDIKGTFANGEGIDLKNGECPSISVYAELLGGIKIYASKNSCNDGFGTINSRCSPNLSPNKTDESAESVTGNQGTGGQFSLVEQGNNSCRYRRVLDHEIAGEDPQHTDITITPSGSNNVKGSCANNREVTCDVEINVPQNFYSNSTFSFLQFIYTDLKTTSYNNGDVIISTQTYETYTITATGGSSDKDKSYISPSNPDGTSIPDDMKGNNGGNGNGSTRPLDPIDINGTTIECSDIFNMEEGALGWLLVTILNYIKVIGPILVVLLSAVDFVKAVFSSDDKAIKEAQSKLIIRLIAAIALFLVPTLIQVLLSFINQTTCTL